MYKYKAQEQGGSTIIVRCGVSSRAYAFIQNDWPVVNTTSFFFESFRLGNEKPKREKPCRKNKKNRPNHWVGFATGSPEMFPSDMVSGWESDHLERSRSTLPVTDIGGLYLGQFLRI
ncbi:MAG: hypothetical protein WC837_02580 [Bellilinea sp.]